MYRPHHFQAYHCSAILTYDNVFNIIRLFTAVHKQSSKPLSSNINRADNGYILADILTFKSQCFQIYIFFCR